MADTTTPAPGQPVGSVDLVNTIKGGVQNLSQLTESFGTLADAITAATTGSLVSVNGGTTGLTFSIVSQIATMAGTLDILNGGTGVTSVAAITALLDLFSSTLQGVVPASGGGTTNFLRADATWAAPPASASNTTGEVTAFAMTSVPTGWLECNGAAVSRTTFSALFTTIGVVWGAGNGTTTFNIPDLRGYFIRGWDDGAGIDPGRTFASTQASAFASHVHTYGSGPGATGTGGLPGFLSGGCCTPGHYAGGNPPLNSGATGTGTDTRPINKALMYCIKT